MLFMIEFENIAFSHQRPLTNEKLQFLHQQSLDGELNAW